MDRAAASGAEGGGTAPANSRLISSWLIGSPAMGFHSRERLRRPRQTRRPARRPRGRRYCSTNENSLNMTPWSNGLPRALLVVSKIRRLINPNPASVRSVISALRTITMMLSRMRCLLSSSRLREFLGLPLRHAAIQVKRDKQRGTGNGLVGGHGELAQIDFLHAAMRLGAAGMASKPFGHAVVLRFVLGRRARPRAAASAAGFSGAVVVAGATLGK